MALASIGTDTGGSIRIPAAVCGVVGLKPTYGEVPTGGVVPLSRGLDHVGPLAVNVNDAWLVYRCLTGLGTSRPRRASIPIVGLRLAVPREYFCDVLDEDVRARFDEALDRLQHAGARIIRTEIHRTGEIAAIYLATVAADAAAYHAATLETMPDRYTRPVRTRLEMGRYVLAEDYVRAQLGREVLRREVDAALGAYDALLLPSLPIPAPLFGVESIRIGQRDEPVRNLMLRLTQLFNLTGHPAISVPCGRTSGGLPCGLQLVGARGQTDGLLGVALACEPILS
jgi:aspartyl-tRNA(Asn)/glutamyl-tRNA(Gln) amidotransferase subunit A